MMRDLFRVAVFGITASVALPLAAQSPYLPLEVGNRWTLRSKNSARPIVIDVLGRKGNGFHVRFDSRFTTDEWVLEPTGNKYYLTQFGRNGQLMDVPGENLYFDFGAEEKASWRAAMGKLSVQSRSASVSNPNVSFDRVFQIRQGNLLFGFAEGKGFVQFGEGKNAHFLDESESVIKSAGSETRSEVRGTREQARPRERRPMRPDDELVPHVPTPGATTARASRGGSSAPARRAGSGRVLFSVTPNIFANESNDPANLLRNYEKAVNTGMSFLVHNAKWDEFEPKAGDYNLYSLKYNVDTAQRRNIPIAYTFRLIETVDRSVPSDLRRLRWTDRKLEDRLRNALTQVVKNSGDRIRWFMIGNEVDGYFGRHPDEIADFAQLFGRMKQHITSLNPSIQVSSTVMYGGINNLDTSLQPLNAQLDFLSITYYPIRGDFTMQEPDVVARDMDRIREVANGRKVIFQEIGYSSGSKNDSNEDKQARFYENVFREFRANSDMIEAGCFFVMADMKDEFVRDLSHFYGIGTDTFKSFLQTLGMYDMKGKPKKSWQVYEREMRR